LYPSGIDVLATGTWRALSLAELWCPASGIHAFLTSGGDNLFSGGVGLGADDIGCVTEVSDSSDEEVGHAEGGS
jgi:hypothetical protein